MQSPYVELNQVRVGYRRTPVLEDFNLKVEPGQILGLLGANGAGKTTAIRTMLGMISPRMGSVNLFGRKPSVREYADLGFAPEEGAPPGFLYPDEFLKFSGELRGLAPREAQERSRMLLDLLEVPAREKKAAALSKGNQRRLILAQAMIHNPKLLILDEPLNGLDPLIVIKLRKQLESMRAGGSAILYSSHILTEVEKTCTHVAIVVRGKCLHLSPTASVVQSHGSVEALFALISGKAS